MFCNDHRESKEMLVQINGLQFEVCDTRILYLFIYLLRFIQYFHQVMEVLLTFLYTAKTTIDPTNVQMLLEAANLFQIDLLRRVSKI